MLRRYSLCGFLLLAGAVACGSTDSTSPTVAVDDPAQAQFVSSDLTNFWAAYDAGGRTGNSSVFQSMYLDHASPGLKSFIASRSLTGQVLASVVTTYPRYFASIESTDLQLTGESAVIAQIRSNYSHIKQLYPAAAFPPVTFLVGRFSTGGTTTATGLLIGTEFYSMSSSTPTDELNLFEKTNVKPLDSLPIIVAHEHVHALQLRVSNGIQTHSNKTLLEWALIEGSADFVGSLSSGGNINAWMFPYALANEHALWVDFSAAMHGTDISQWLYKQTMPPPGRPGDLGYFIGYRIAESYYNSSADKTAALRDIIEVRDGDAFLSLSKYSP
jgi:uncharacterized protein YjaZ